MMNLQYVQLFSCYCLLNAWFLPYIINTKHIQKIFVFDQIIDCNTNLHNSIEEAGVTKIIDAFDRNQGAVDYWTLASEWLCTI